MAEMLATRTKKRCSPDRRGLPQVYMRQRWYDCTLQRFISRDPIGLQGGANLYAYARANPVVFTDPSGLQGRLTSEDPRIQAQLSQIRRSKYGQWLEDQLDSDITVEFAPRVNMSSKDTCGQWVRKQRKIQLDMRILNDYKMASQYSPDPVAARRAMDAFLRAIIVHEMQHALHDQHCGCDNNWADELNARYVQGLYLLTDLDAHGMKLDDLYPGSFSERLAGLDNISQARAAQGNVADQQSLWDQVHKDYEQFTVEHYRKK